jgi:hypothetical protein
MITLLDHGNSSGSVSVDASTYRTHRWTATGNITLGAPTGLDDGESVTLIVDTAGSYTVSLDAAYVGSGAGIASGNSFFKGIATKVGSSFFIH